MDTGNALGLIALQQCQGDAVDRRDIGLAVAHKIDRMFMPTAFEGC
jgi:hypothetical protein